MSVEREEIERGVVRFRCSSRLSAAVGYEVSAYVIDGVLIDTGFPRIGSALLPLLAREDIRGVVVTHWHEDHAGNVAALAARGIPVLMHPETEATLRERPGILPYRSVIWGRSGRLEQKAPSFDPSPLEILQTPGHAHDHLVVWDPSRRIVASGDLFLGVKVRVAHVHESPRALVQSLRLVAALEPRLLLDAHRGPVPDASSVLRAKADWLEETLAEIYRLADRGLRPRSIARELLGREELVGIASGGEYSKRALVSAALHERARHG